MRIVDLHHDLPHADKLAVIGAGAIGRLVQGDDGDQLAFRNVKIDVQQRRHTAPAFEMFTDLLERDN